MEDFSLHILDIAENAVAAGARKVDIRITEDEDRDLMTIEIVDDGKGMSQEALKKATDPFFTTKKRGRVGLGLPLLLQAARECDGQLEIKSRFASFLKRREGPPRHPRRMARAAPVKEPAGSKRSFRKRTKNREGGTAVRATFKRSHIDRKPLGDMAQTLATLVAGHPEVRFTYAYRKGETGYSLDTGEMRGKGCSDSNRARERYDQKVRA